MFKFLAKHFPEETICLYIMNWSIHLLLIWSSENVIEGKDESSYKGIKLQMGDSNPNL